MLDCPHPMLPDALARIQSSLRVAASRNRETARLGPFLATFSPASDLPFLSYAIPDANADPTPDDIAALVAFYAARERTPRLEYIPDLAPKVEPALLAAGFAIEIRAPVMVLGTLRPAPIPEGVVLIEAQGYGDVRNLVGALNEAYGGEPPTDAEVERQRRRIEDGTIALLAKADGEPVGGGLVVPPEEGLAEVTSIGVREGHRRRGVAAALTSRLTELALARGVETPFLMAGGEPEARIYARVGYRRVGEILFVSTSDWS